MKPRILATMTPTSWPLVRPLVVLGSDCDVGINVGGDDEEEVDVNPRIVVDGEEERDEERREVDEVGVTVVEDSNGEDIVVVVGVAVVVDRVAVVAGNVPVAIEAGNVEPPNIQSVPSGILGPKYVKGKNSTDVEVAIGTPFASSTTDGTGVSHGGYC